MLAGRCCRRALRLRMRCPQAQFSAPNCGHQLLQTQLVWPEQVMVSIKAWAVRVVRRGASVATASLACAQVLVSSRGTEVERTTVRQTTQKQTKKQAEWLAQSSLPMVGPGAGPTCPGRQRTGEGQCWCRCSTVPARARSDTAPWAGGSQMLILQRSCHALAMSCYREPVSLKLAPTTSHEG